MLLRTSSAPSLITTSLFSGHLIQPSSLPSSPSLPHRQASSAAEFHPLSTSSSSCSSSSSSSSSCPLHHRRPSAECHANSSSSSSDLPFVSRPPLLYRAQSEGDLLSTFSVSMTAASQEFKESALSSQDGSNLGFLSLGSGFSGSGNGGIGFYSRPTAEEGSHGSSDDQTDSYYQSMLQRNPNNPLFLSNYAQFLAERGDVRKSEECYERAILADPYDGDVLSQYAKLQWAAHKDERRAEMYYDQAIQAAPNDCYVMASYASFLWDVEEEHGDMNPSPSSAPMSLHDDGGSALNSAILGRT